MALAADLQREGAAAFVKSWEELLACIGKKSATFRAVTATQPPRAFHAGFAVTF